MKERILHCFNKGAQTYEKAAEVQAIVAERLAKRIPQANAETILEIGCGTGLFSRQLVTQFPEASLLLTDLAPAMVNTCQQHFINQPRIKVACMDGEALSFPMKFDLVVSSMTLHWFTEFKKSFTQIINKLTPGGHFSFAMLGMNSLIEWREICKKLNMPISTPEFPMLHNLQTMFPEIKMETEVLPQRYANSYEFLQVLKKIGATATNLNYVPLSAGKLRRALREFNDELIITYEVIYGNYVKI